MPKGKFISYIKARNMISKGFICHLVRHKKVDAVPLNLQCIPVVKQFQDVFPKDLPGLLPE